MTNQFSFIKASKVDAPVVRDLVNRHELAVDPDAATMSDDGVAELMAGYIDESQGWLVIDGGQQVCGFVQMHPDANRSLFFPDVYCDPSHPYIEQLTASAVDFVLSQTQIEHPHWSLRAGLNAKDDLLRGAYASRGFSYLRKFWSLSRPIFETDAWPALPPGVEITQVQETREAMLVLHALHQDAFSKHFGFKPREFENWMALQLEQQTRDPAGSFLLSYEGEPAGFVLSATEMKHENGGYIDLIGVAHEFQGRGFGRLLLQIAIAYAKAQGFEKINLNVDTGNESAALRVYEAAGFKPFSAWEQFELIRGNA